MPLDVKARGANDWEVRIEDIFEICSRPRFKPGPFHFTPAGLSRRIAMTNSTRKPEETYPQTT